MSSKKRTSKKQFAIYLQCIKEHDVLRSGKLNPQLNPQELLQLWNTVADSLNCCGDGPVRTIAEWRKVFTECKSATRKKSRDGKPLNDLETKLITLTGAGAVTGLPVEELGQTVILTSNSEQEAEEYFEDEEDTHSENIVFEVINGENEVQEETQTATQTKVQGNKKKRSRKTTGDILTDAYTNAVKEQSESLNNISNSIMAVANAIHRYCDIIEK